MALVGNAAICASTGRSSTARSQAVTAYYQKVPSIYHRRALLPGVQGPAAVASTSDLKPWPALRARETAPKQANPPRNWPRPNIG